MRTLISCPNVASICPASKSKKVCKNINLDPPLHGMRCAIVALMTFLVKVVTAFNPERTLLNPSPKQAPLVLVLDLDCHPILNLSVL